MKVKDIALLSLCWASLMPAIEAQKEPSVYEQAMKLHTLAKELRPCFILQLPNETLEAIAIKLLPPITHAHSQDELKKAVQAITRLQRSSTCFNAVINDYHYQEKLKASLKAALNNLNIPLDLHLAINNERSHFIINTLIKAGAQLDIQDNYGRTVLFWAAINGHNDIVDTVIKAGAQLDIQDSYGATALMEAAFKGHTDIVDALIKAGAQLDIQDKDERTALISAAMSGHNDIVNTVIKAGAQLDIQTKNGKTALIWAAGFGHNDIVDTVIKAGAQLDIQDNDGDTALIWAAIKGHNDIVNTVIRAGAQLDIQNNYGYTALDIAREEKYTTIVQLLESAMHNQSSNNG